MLLQLKEAESSAPLPWLHLPRRRGQRVELQALQRALFPLAMFDKRNNQFVDTDGEKLDDSLVHLELISRRNRDHYFN